MMGSDQNSIYLLPPSHVGDRIDITIGSHQCWFKLLIIIFRYLRSAQVVNDKEPHFVLRCASLWVRDEIDDRFAFNNTLLIIFSSSSKNESNRLDLIALRIARKNRKLLKYFSTDLLTCIISGATNWTFGCQTNFFRVVEVHWQVITHNIEKKTGKLVYIYNINEKDDG